MLQIDVRAAFLNSDLAEEIYMDQPRGFVKKGQEARVLLLEEAICGLKQACREWRKNSEQILKCMGYTFSHSDPGLYFMEKEGVFSTALIVYFDDILIPSREDKDLLTIAEKNANHVDIRVETTVNKLLGTIIDEDKVNGIIKIHNDIMIESTLHRFAMSNCETGKNSTLEGSKLVKATEDAKEKANMRPYKKTHRGSYLLRKHITP